METKAAATLFCSRGETLSEGLHWRQVLHSLWRRILQARRRIPKSLLLHESLSLGERRFLAVVECEGERFLIGGTTSSLSMLTRLDDAGRRQHLPQNDRFSQQEDVG